MRYRLQGVFTRLTGLFGIEDQNGAPAALPVRERGRAQFSIFGDGSCLLPPTWKVYGEAPESFDLDITGVDALELRVTAPVEQEAEFRASRRLAGVAGAVIIRDDVRDQLHAREVGVGRHIVGHAEDEAGA